MQKSGSALSNTTTLRFASRSIDETSADSSLIDCSSSKLIGGLRNVTVQTSGRDRLIDNSCIWLILALISVSNWYRQSRDPWPAHGRKSKSFALLQYQACHQ